MDVRSDEVVNRKVIFAIVKPGAASNDLFELDHGLDWTHQNNVANIPGVYPGRKLLRRSQNGWNCFLVILKIPQVLIPELSIVRRDPLAIVWVRALFHLIDEVAYGQRMVLRGAEDKRL